ncbi:hypothetical protein [Knoellia subterranea]|uniref:Heavy metal-binding domain-containing protein n=1 Tax=Knoellia subterranea KCTC 19937 TaxID=1385521 RepID=A0A0A0JJ45_9MICO|nr:hypothetical protein [Knoellia subterranea]KGN37103.1 hypothetical protein N803_14665 [Knoellia subterranea KCTC 19937]
MADLSNVSTPVRVAGFVAALVAVFGLTLLAGRAFGPVGEEVAGSEQSDGHGHGATTPAPTGTTGSAGSTGSSAPSEHAAHLPGGLQVSQDGYSLQLLQTEYSAAGNSHIVFVIQGPDGAPVTEYVPQHEKELHLIAVRRDFSGFQHVHPEMSIDGTWSTSLALTPGSWRLFADTAPKGAEPLTLGADVSVAGTFAPAAAPVADLRTAEVDGYTVNLQGDLTPGKDSALTLSVSRGGQPVTNLDPYLGAYGHLVALREGDLAYLHVHPEGHPGDGTTKPGPGITFGTTVPSPGTYHFYLDFQHKGVVRTAAFTVTAEGPTAGAEGGHDDHAH